MSCRPTIFGDEVLAVARNAAARFMLRPWFQLDADVALVGGNLSLEQGRQLATLAALSGGPFFASDDLVRLPPGRLALLTNPEVMELVGGAPAVPDWEPNQADRPPMHWRRGAGHTRPWRSVASADLGVRCIRGPGTASPRPWTARRPAGTTAHTVRAALGDLMLAGRPAV